MAFISYIPLVWIAKTQSIKKLFYQGLFFGVLFNLGSLYWLYTALNSFGGLHPAISIFVQILLSFILAFYFVLPWCLAKWVSQKNKIDFYFVLPIFFIAAEWCRCRWPMGGFPWGQIGYSQARTLSLIQIADIFGVYGVTTLVLWGNLWCFEIVKKIFPSPLRGGGRKRGRGVKLLFFPLLLLCTFLYGKHQIQQLQSLEEKSAVLKAAFIQGNIQQDEKWDTTSAKKIMGRYEQLTQQAAEEGAQFIFWPESSYPYDVILNEKAVLLSTAKNLLGKNEDRALILGAITEDHPHSDLFHNSALLIDSKKLSVYHKQKLVPYGEYVPLKEYLPFLDKLTVQVGNFYPGQKFSLLESQGAKIGSLICYEDIFPEVARGHAFAGANLLANLTNDAWYGPSSALPQHLNFSIFRAVENRRMLVRVTNTGASAFIHSWGALESELPYWKEAVGKGEIKLLEVKSFYTRYGDVFAYFCLLSSLFGILLSLLKRNPYSVNRPRCN
ncbi:MAG: apolipoprotein N-acyltransferase [Deltaproteobacteria bacterium]|nr:apolipoprotein N-acyltransferase [Deltaproteobacteria bacterium]